MFGAGSPAVLWLQVVLDAARVIVVYAIAYRVFGLRRVALLAAGAAALLEPYLFFAAAPLKTTLSLLFFDLALLAGLLAAERRTGLAALGFGVATGLAALTRPNVLLILVPFSVWAVYRFRAAGQGRGIAWPRLAQYVAAAWAGAFLCLAPVTIANVVRGGELVLISANFGHTLYVGNNPDNPRSGLHLSPRGVAGDPLREEAQWTREAERRAGRTLTPRQRELFWLGESLRFIAAQPGDFVRRTGHKALLLSNAYEIPDNRNVYFLRRHVPWSLRGPLPLLTFGTVLPLALLGAWWTVRRPGAPRFVLAVGLAYAASLLPFVVSARYRLPLVTCALPFAAYALLELVRLAKQVRAGEHPKARLARAVAALAVFAAFVHLPLVDGPAFLARDAYDLAVLRNQQGRHEEAAALAREALAGDPTLQQAWLEAGIALSRLERTAEAVVAYGQATVGRGDIAGLAWLNLGLLQRRRGDLPAARNAFRRAIPLLTWNPEARALAERQLRLP